MADSACGALDLQSDYHANEEVVLQMIEMRFVLGGGGCVCSS